MRMVLPKQKPEGPQVPDIEDLYRALLHAEWYIEDETPPVVSTAAFAYDRFSADIAGRTSPEKVLSRFNEGTGLVEFNCGKAREVGFDAHEEKDKKNPGNDAHAHVYYTKGSGQGDKKALQAGSLPALQGNRKNRVLADQTRPSGATPA